ncbi:uncharacterized protein LOC142494645 [Ascaphus truei]|uniref:uncharacterized protein LOC142494645 n=1 Tax=Ascaphus truei TaxID=8439 RepID=UPI003F599420
MAEHMAQSSWCMELTSWRMEQAGCRRELAAQRNPHVTIHTMWQHSSAIINRMVLIVSSINSLTCTIQQCLESIRSSCMVTTPEKKCDTSLEELSAMVETPSPSHPAAPQMAALFTPRADIEAWKSSHQMNLAVHLPKRGTEIGAAPALIDVPARVQVCIPMANIKATIGKLPTNPKDIALWLNERTHCLDGVYPTPTANQKLALVNSLLPAGLSITLAEARDWDSVISNVYEKTHGKVTISSLADTLGQVNKTSGIVAAYILGLRFTQGNHEIVWGCLKALIKGQGLLLDLERQIQGVPVEQKPIMVPEILKNTYTLVGRSLTGDPIGLTKPQASDRKPERTNAEKRGNFLVQERKWRPPFTQYQTPVYPRDEQWDRRAHTPRNPAAWTPQIGHSVQERVAKVKPLRPKWKKPTTILKKINERTFIIQDTKGRERKVSIDNLKPTAHCSNVTVQDGGDTVSATDFDRAAASRSTDCKTTGCGN